MDTFSYYYENTVEGTFSFLAFQKDSIISSSPPGYFTNSADVKARYDVYLSPDLKFSERLMQ